MEMFTKEEGAIKTIGERGLIRLIQEYCDSVVPAYPEGIGDDCAVMRSRCDFDKLVATSDSVRLCAHFSEHDDAYWVGRKLVNRNISDIAAMGAIPAWGLLNLFLPSNLHKDWFIEFLRGLTSACMENNFRLVGGDICSLENSQFIGSMTCNGYSNSPVLRKGGEEGDLICCTGNLGGSLLGKHLQFTPRVKEGIWFSNQPETRAMMDITDGIAKDLLTMLEGVDLLSADLFLNTLPISEACHKYSQKTKKPAWEHALSDGEDYELLVLLKKGSDFNSFQKRWREAFNLSLSCIGIVSARGSGILWNSETNCKIEGLLGYEHIG